jgi:CelD/BcsL family acetyltransferase involved in cellulose biosynthesis
MSMSNNQFSSAHPTRLRYSILRSIEELSSIKVQWDGLWAETGAEYYLSFSSIQHCWNEIHRPQGASLCCAVVFDNHDLLGVWPMILHRYKFTSIAKTCGPGSAEGCGLLIKKSSESPVIATALLQNFLTLVRPDYLQLEFVRLGSALEVALQSLPSRGMINTWDEIIPHADLKQETSWPSYKDCLSKSYQANTARARRRLSELGKMNAQVVRGEANTLIEWIFLHKKQWSERTNKRGEWVFSKFYQQYLKVLMSSEPKFILFVLTLDGTPIAASMVAIDTKSASWIITTYDEKYKRFSPGNILAESMIEHVFENCRGADGERLNFIFGPGKENTKMQWSRGHADVARSYSIVTSNWGAARMRVRRIVTSIRNRVFLR